VDRKELSNDELMSLHSRLCDGDPTASAQLAEALFFVLVSRLTRYKQATDEEAADAASRALMEYLKNPSRYDPTKSRLTTHLHNAAFRDFLNDRQKARRRRSREISVERVEDLEDGRNKVVGIGAASRTEPNEWLLEVEDAWTIVRTEFPNETDQELLQLMLSGERSTERYAELLDIADATVEEQRRQVKQHKDRIQKRLTRLRERFNQ
jgi:RNA polymerase sigma-70 factor (ECF subfamily)